MIGETKHLALSAVGRDRPGIVAAVSECLLEYGLNIEDSRMTILGGHFAMMLILSSSATLEQGRLRGDLDRVARELDLEAISLGEVEEIATAQWQPSHVVTVYGLDHPGIVHAVSSLLAERQVDITDLSTRLVTDEDSPLYGLFMEVAIPAGERVETLKAALEELAVREGVRVSLRELQQATL